MRILGIDYGSKNIGIAVSDDLMISAFGVETITRQNESEIKKVIAKLKEIIDKYEAPAIVLGYPKRLDNTDSERCVKTLEFEKRLRRNFKNAEIILWDERFTTVTAKKELRNLGCGNKKIKSAVDETAAVLILQNYLENRRNTAANG